MKQKNVLKFVGVLIEFIIFVDFWIILVVSLWGGVSYRLIKIFSSYFETNSILRPLIIWLVTIGIWRMLKFLSPDRIFINIFKNPYYYLVTIILVYTAIALPVYLQPYYTFSYSNAHDFAARHHAVYNSLIGNMLKSDIFPYHRPFRNWNFLGDQFSLIIPLLVPIYYFCRNGSILVICQSIAVILGTIPIFLIANEKLKSRWIALITSLLYLLYPLTIKLSFCEFRQEYFAIPLLLFGFYYIQKGKVGISLIFLLFVTLCREVGFLAVAIMGVYIFFCRKRIKYKRIIGVLVFSISITVLFFIVEYIIPRMNAFGFYGYGPLGGKQKLISILFNPIKIMGTHEPERLAYLINIIKPLGFIPLMSSLILLAFPFLLQNWLTDILATVVHIWHSAFIVPFLFIALIYGLYNVFRIFKNVQMVILIWLCCSSLYGGGAILMQDIIEPFFRQKLYIDAKPDIYKEFCKAEEIVPKDKSIFTHFSLLPNLTNREKIFWRATVSSAEEVDADYLFFSPEILNRNGWDKELMDEIIDSKKYLEVFISDNFTVMVRKDFYEKQFYVISEFRKEEKIELWEINVSNCDYKYVEEEGAVPIYLYFDGDDNEDEFIQMRKTDLDVNLKEYPIFYLDYNMIDADIQTIEIVFGVDMDSDKAVDAYIKRVYVPFSTEGSRWSLNVSDLIRSKYPNTSYYSIVELELYPHKVYGVNCSKEKKGWYKFGIREVGFKRVVLSNT